MWMEQTATICGGQVWKALFKGAPSLVLGQKGEANGRKIQICEFARRVTAPSALRPAPRPHVGCCEQRKYHDDGGATAHKFVTAVLQMASSIFPARPFLPPRPRSALILHRGAGWIRGPPMSIRGRRAEISATGRIVICDWLNFVTFMPTCDHFVIVEKWSLNLISDQIYVRKRNARGSLALRTGHV